MACSPRLLPTPDFTFRYKAFLDSVTPCEWFASHEAALKARQAAAMDKWHAECAAVRQAKEDAAAAKANAEADYRQAPWVFVMACLVSLAVLANLPTAAD